MSSLRDALVIVAAGLALSFFFVRPVLRAWRGRRWPHAAGTVTGSPVDNEPSGLSVAKARYFVHVSYRYDAGGSAHTGERVSFFGTTIPHKLEQAARDDARRYAKGKPVDVRYDPRDPAVSVIDASIPWFWGAAAAFSALFLLLGLFGLARILLA